MKKKKRSITNLSREAYIKKKTRNFLFFIYLIVLASALLSGILIGLKPMNVLILIIAIFLFEIVFSFAFKKVLYTLYDIEFNRISSENLVNESLSSETFTEVIPLHRIYEHSYFLVSLTNIAKFYAIIRNGSEVSIYIQFNAEDELRFLEDIPKGKFQIRYKLK